MQDILHQFSTLETKTIFGFPHLPPFLHPQIISRLQTDPTMTYTAQALNEGFPLLLNPMVDIEHQSQHIEASVLLTIPEISDLNSFCTVEYLSPIKINSSNICYSGPVTKLNLVLISCPNSKQIVTSESLEKFYRDSNAIVCPANILNTATNFTWLGFPFNPDTKLTFLRNHVRANDCSNLHPLIHLGGRMFLATTTMVLPLSWGSLLTSPLTVYNFPCNQSFTGMVTGLDNCSPHLNVLIPLATTTDLQFTPWSSMVHNDSFPHFTHQALAIPPPAALNKTVLNNLDDTFNTLDDRLSTSMTTMEEQIEQIHDSSVVGTTDAVAYCALAFSIVNGIGFLTLIVCYRRKYTTLHKKSPTDTTTPKATCRCGRPPRTTTGDHATPGIM